MFGADIEEVTANASCFCHARQRNFDVDRREQETNAWQWSKACTVTIMDIHNNGELGGETAARPSLGWDGQTLVTSWCFVTYREHS